MSRPLDVEALVMDPDDLECGLLVHDGSPVIYQCRIDLVAVDAADEYWVVFHQIVDEWQDVDRWDRDAQLMAQEEAQQSVEIADGGGSSGSAPVTVGAGGEVVDAGAPRDAGKVRRPR